jgi:hypothetical protein
MHTLLLGLQVTALGVAGANFVLGNNFRDQLVSLLIAALVITDMLRSPVVQ